MRLPEADEPVLRVERVYRPAHNIGHFRYLECSKLDESGQPTGEITSWEQVLFPFDSQLWAREDISSVPVEGMNAGEGVLAREEYTCDANGDLRVKISALPSGKSREFEIGRLTSQ